MKIGIALGSGGAKGFAHIAYLQAIDEMGLKINAISGTSMGAFIGAFYAGGMSANDLHSLVKSFGILDAHKVITLSALPKSGLIHGDRIETFLRKNLPVQRFEDLKIPMKISVTDYWNKEEYVFEQGDIVPAIRASISIPGIFKPFYYKCNLFVDGGLVNPVPFDLLTGNDFIIAIDVIGSEFIEGNKFPGTLDALSGSYQIMKKAIMKQKDFENKIDMYCAPNLRKYRSLWFHKSEAIIHAAKIDVEHFKRELPVRMAQKSEAKNYLVR